MSLADDSVVSSPPSFSLQSDSVDVQAPDGVPLTSSATIVSPSPFVSLSHPSLLSHTSSSVGPTSVGSSFGIASLLSQPGYRPRNPTHSSTHSSAMLPPRFLQPSARLYSPSMSTVASNHTYHTTTSPPQPTASTGTLLNFIPLVNPAANHNSNLTGVLGSPHNVASFAPALSPPASFLYPAFVVGPGFPPVSPKLVMAIVSGEFVELAQLLENSTESDDPNSFSLWDGRLVLRPRRRSRELHDIMSWVQAFSIYSLVLTSYHPHRAADLLRYKLLILRTSQQFQGSCWFAYDRAFRRDAAARTLTDWSRMSPDLFNFYTAASGPNRNSPSDLSGEAVGSPASPTVCRSWNAGRCSSSFRQCRFRHACAVPGCTGLHRESVFHGSRGPNTFSGSPRPPSLPIRKRQRDSWYD